MTQPAMQIQGPVAQRYLFGLQSVVSDVESVPDMREFALGITADFDCPAAAMGSTDKDLCDPHTGKTLPGPNIDWPAKPFRGYGGLFCKLPGREDLIQRAQAVFDLIEWPYIEEQSWTGSAGGTPFLASALANDITPVAGTGIPLEDGIGLLDTWLATQLGQLGVIWAPRPLIGWFESKLLGKTAGPKKVDPAGNAIAFIASSVYPGPSGGAVAGAGEYWLYATAPVMVRRSDEFRPELGQALDRKENEVFAIVERQFLVLWGCEYAAVLVNPTLP